MQKREAVDFLLFASAWGALGLRDERLLGFLAPLMGNTSLFHGTSLTGRYPRRRRSRVIFFAHFRGKQLLPSPRMIWPAAMIWKS